MCKKSRLVEQPQLINVVMSPDHRFTVLRLVFLYHTRTGMGGDVALIDIPIKVEDPWILR